MAAPTCARTNKFACRTSEKLPDDAEPMNLTMGDLCNGRPNKGFAMSYAEAKQIALLRLELRSCWDRADYAGASVALASLRQISVSADNDNELTAEVKRWAFKLDVAA